jgi:hypothetical membrane protein
MPRYEADMTPPSEERGSFETAMGIVGILGCLSFIVAVVVGDIVVPDHDFVADTISDLGAGQYEMIADVGIYSFSAALIACALGGAHAHLGGDRWSWALGGLAFLGLIVFLVGARNEYGDGDDEGVVIHIYLVYALGLLFAVIPWAMARGAGIMGRGWRVAFRWCAAVWAVAAPVFFFLPTGIDGLYERGLMLIAIVFTVILSALLIVRGRRV